MTLVYTGWTIPERALVQIEEDNRNGKSTKAPIANHVQRTQVMSWSYSDNATSTLFTHADVNTDGTNQLRGCCVVTLYMISECNYHKREFEDNNNKMMMKYKNSNEGDKEKNNSNRVSSNNLHQTMHEKEIETTNSEITLCSEMEKINDNDNSENIVGVEWELHFLPTPMEEKVTSLKSMEKESIVNQDRVEYRATYRFYGSHYRVTPSTLSGTSGVIFLSSHDILIQTRNSKKEECTDTLSLDRFTLVEQSVKQMELSEHSSPITIDSKELKLSIPHSSSRCNWVRHAKAWSIEEILQNATVCEESETMLTNYKLQQLEEYKECKWKEELVLCTALPRSNNISNNIVVNNNNSNKNSSNMTVNANKDEWNAQHVLFVTSKRLYEEEDLEKEIHPDRTDEHHIGTNSNDKMNTVHIFMAGVVEIRVNTPTKELENRLVHLTCIHHDHFDNDSHNNRSSNDGSVREISHELQEIRPEEWIWMFLPSQQMITNLKQEEEEELLHSIKGNAQNQKHQTIKKNDNRKINYAHGCIVALKYNQHEHSAYDAISESKTVYASKQLLTAAAAAERGVILHGGEVCCCTNSIVNNNYTQTNTVNLALSFCHPNLTLRLKSEEEWCEYLQEENSNVLMATTRNDESNKLKCINVDSNNQNIHREYSEDADHQSSISNTKKINVCTYENKIVHLLTYTRCTSDDITNVNDKESPKHMQEQISVDSSGECNNKMLYNFEVNRGEVDVDSLQGLTVYELSVLFTESPCNNNTSQSACDSDEMERGLHTMQLHVARVMHVPENVIWMNNTSFIQENKTHHRYTHDEIVSEQCWRSTPLPQVSYVHNTEADTCWCMYNTILFNQSNAANTSSNTASNSETDNTPSVSNALCNSGSIDIMCVHNQIRQCCSRQHSTFIKEEESEEMYHNTHSEIDKEVITSDLESKNSKSLELMFATRQTDFTQWLAVRVMEEYHDLMYSKCVNTKNSNRKRKSSKVVSNVQCRVLRFVLHELWPYALEEMNTYEKREVTIALMELENNISKHTWTKSSFATFSEYTKFIINSTLSVMCNIASTLETSKNKIKAMILAFAHLLRRTYLEFLVSLDWIAVNVSDRKLLKQMVMFYLGINPQKQIMKKERSQEDGMSEHVNTIQILLHVAAFSKCITESNNLEHTIISKDDNNNNNINRDGEMELEQWFRRNLLLYVYLSDNAILELMLCNLYDCVQITTHELKLEEYQGKDDEQYKNRYAQSKTERLAMEFALLHAVDVNELWNTVRQHTHNYKYEYLYNNSVPTEEIVIEDNHNNYLTWYDWHALLCTWDADNLQMLHLVTVHDDNEIDAEETEDNNSNDNNYNKILSLFVLMWCVDLICRVHNKNNKLKHSDEHTWEWSEEEEQEKIEWQSEEGGNESTICTWTVKQIQKEIKESLMHWEQIISPSTSCYTNDDSAKNRKQEPEMNTEKITSQTAFSLPEQWMYLTLHDLDYFPFNALPPLASILVMQHLLHSDLSALYCSINVHNVNDDNVCRKLYNLSKYEFLVTLYKSWIALRWLALDSNECSQIVFDSLHELCASHHKHRFRCLPIAAFAELPCVVATVKYMNLWHSQQEHILRRDEKEYNQENNKQWINNSNISTNDECTGSKNYLLVLQCVHRLWTSATSPLLRLQISRALFYCNQTETVKCRKSELSSPAQDTPQHTLSNENSEIAHELAVLTEKHFSMEMEKQWLTEEICHYTFQQFIAVWEHVWCATGTTIITNTVMSEKFLEAVLSALEEYKRNSKETNNVMKGQAEMQRGHHTILFDTLCSRIFVLLRPIYMYCIPKLTQILIQSIQEVNKKLYVQYDACINNGKVHCFTKLTVEEVYHQVFDTMTRLCALLAPVNKSFACLSQLTRLLHEESNTIVNYEKFECKYTHESITSQKHNLERKRLEKKSKQRREIKEEKCIRSIWEVLLMSELSSMFAEEMVDNNTCNKYKKKQHSYVHKEEEEKWEQYSGKHDFGKDEKIYCSLTFTPSHRTCFFVSKLQEYNSTRINTMNSLDHSNQENNSNKLYSENNDTNDKNEEVTSLTSITLLMESLRRELLYFTLFDLLRVKWIRLALPSQTSKSSYCQEQRETLSYSNIEHSMECDQELNQMIVLEVTSLFTPEDAFNTLASQTESLSHILSEQISVMYDKAIIMLLLDVMFSLFANTNLETDLSGSSEKVDNSNNNNNNNNNNNYKNNNKNNSFANELENVRDDTSNSRTTCTWRINSDDKEKFQEWEKEEEKLQYHCRDINTPHIKRDVQTISVDKNNLVCSRCILPITSSSLPSSPHSSLASPMKLKVQSTLVFVEEMKRCILYIAQNTLRNVSERTVRPLLCSLTKSFQNFLYCSLLQPKLDWFVCLQENVNCTKDAKDNKLLHKEITDDIDTNRESTSEVDKQFMRSSKLRYVKSPFHTYMSNHVTQTLMENVNNMLSASKHWNENIEKSEREGRLEREHVNRKEERQLNESKICNLTEVQQYEQQLKREQQEQEQQYNNEENVLMNFANKLSNILWSVSSESYIGNDIKINVALNDAKEITSTPHQHEPEEVQMEKEICTLHLSNECAVKIEELESRVDAERSAKDNTIITTNNYTNANTQIGSLFAPSLLTRHLLTSVGKHIAPIPRSQRENLPIEREEKHVNENFTTVESPLCFHDKANVKSTEIIIPQEQWNNEQESTLGTEHTISDAFINTKELSTSSEGKDRTHERQHATEKTVQSTMRKKESVQPVQHYREEHHMDILLLTKEEEARRRKLTEMLLHEYYNNIMYSNDDKLRHDAHSISECTNSNHNSHKYNVINLPSERNISMELQELYLTLRCERRRRELEWYAEEQKDLILTFCSKIHEQYLREIRVALRVVLIDIAERCAAEFNLLRQREHDTRRAIEEEYVGTLSIMKTHIRSVIAFVRDEDEMRQIMLERENDLWNALIYAFDLETSYILENITWQNEEAWGETIPFSIDSSSTLGKKHIIGKGSNSINDSRRQEQILSMQTQWQEPSEQVMWGRELEKEDQILSNNFYSPSPHHASKELEEHPKRDNSGPNFDLMAEAGANLWHAFGKLQTKLRETVAPAPVQSASMRKISSTHVFESPSFESSPTLEEHKEEKEQQQETWQNANANNTTDTLQHEIHTATWQITQTTLPKTATTISSSWKHSKDQGDDWNDEEGWEDVDVIVPTNTPKSTQVIQSSHTTMEVEKWKGSDALTTRGEEDDKKVKQVKTINKHTNNDSNIENIEDYQSKGMEMENKECANVNETNMSDEVEVIDIGPAKNTFNSQITNGLQRAKHNKRKMLASRIDANQLLIPTLMTPSGAANMTVEEEIGDNAKDVVITDNINISIKANVTSQTNINDDKVVSANNENCVQCTTELTHNQESEQGQWRTAMQTEIQAALAELILQEETSNRRHIFMDEMYNKHMLLRHFVLNKD